MHGNCMGEVEEFHPVVNFPPSYWVHDFSKSSTKSWSNPFEFSVGRYDEFRPDMYTEALFEGERCHHIGLDLGAPVGTPIHAFDDGEVVGIIDHTTPGSYGPTIVTHHYLDPKRLNLESKAEKVPVWVLHGHLNWASISHFTEGQSIHRGQIIGCLGSPEENGGWPPHVHVQLSLQAPINLDMPGVVAKRDVSAALQQYLDPRLICGPLY